MFQKDSDQEGNERLQDAREPGGLTVFTAIWIEEARLLSRACPSVPCKAVCLYLAARVGLNYLLGLYLQDKYIVIMGCDLGLGNLLAQQLDL